MSRPFIGNQIPDITEVDIWVYLAHRHVVMCVRNISHETNSRAK